MISKRDPCYHFKFGLIVTGETEEESLPLLFRSISSGLCSFSVPRKIGQISQRKPRTLRMVGQKRRIPSKDEEWISIPCRSYLRKDSCNYLLLIDDLEHDRRPQAADVFRRYRDAVDTLLEPDERSRAAVHFLVNMLEAYYFADAQAVNNALSLSEPLQDHDGDVEEIRNPKGELKRIYQNFDQKEDGRRVLEELDLEHVLSQPDSCAWLRTCVSWIADVLSSYPDEDVYRSLELARRYCLDEGKTSEVTRGQ